MEHSKIDANLPGHCGWKTSSHLPELEQQYHAALAGNRPERRPRSVSTDEVREVLDQLDAQSRWVSAYRGERLVGQPKFASNTRYLSSEVFSRNLELLSQFLKSVP